MSNDTTYQVQFWKLRESGGRRRPWGVRWVTAGKEHSESYTTKALAESFRAELVRAARAGEAFDVTTGLPLSILRRRGAHSLLDLAISYVDHRWPSSPPNTRHDEVQTLAAIIPAFVLDLDHAPPLSSLQTLLTAQYCLLRGARSRSLRNRRQLSYGSAGLRDPSLTWGSPLKPRGSWSD